MNRFFRTAFSTTLVCLLLTLLTVLATGVRMPFPAFSCLYFGLLISLLPRASRNLAGKELLFYLLGAGIALLGVLPLVLWHCPPGHFVIHLLEIAAAAVFVRILRHRTTHGFFMTKYRFTAVALLILIGFIYLAVLTGVYSDGEASERVRLLNLAMNNVIPYAIVLLVTGVLLLRGLRAEEGTVDEQSFNRRQLRDTLIFAVLVTVVFAVDPFVYLQKALLFLVSDVLRPAGSWLLTAIVALMKAVSVQRPEQSTLPTEEVPDAEQMPIIEATEAEPERYFVEASDLARSIAYILIAIAATVLIWILAREIGKLIRKLRERDRKYGSGYPHEIRENIPQEARRRKEKQRKRSADPRERMRWMYGEFLDHLKKRRVEVGRTDTCGEILDRAKGRAAAGSPVLTEFTNLYEQARYQLEEPPTDADARSMKDLLDKIRKKA